MFTRAVRLTGIRGIEVRLDLSLLPFAALVAWFFAARFRGDNDLAISLAMAVVGGLLFFGSILAHELGHALEARHRGLDVERITLFLFGGVTEMHTHSASPRDEFVVAAVGPWISLVCGALFGLIATFAAVVFPAGLAGPVAEVAGLLAWVNVLLAVFNLVPGAPLDGGRVLRAGLWWLLKDRDRALRIAARAGQVLAVAVVLVGLRGIQVAGFDGLLGAVIWVVLGVFLWNAAQAEVRQSDLDRLLDGRRARDLVGVLPDSVALDQPLATVRVSGDTADHHLLPVIDGDEFVGVLPVRDLQGQPQADRADRHVRDLVRDVDHLPRVDLDADVRALIDAFAGKVHAVRLCEGGREVAVVTERQIARALTRLRRSGTPLQATRTAEPST
ncbi:MAG: site-2 protease family protein [Actinobacteria bacterium]|jgi:Zn-dependent protease|nr:site-2 protease family protein [Actinomycetota bacterium]